jgi:hypothetical protein
MKDKLMAYQEAWKHHRRGREAALASGPSSRTSRTKPGSHVKAPPHVPGERGSKKGASKREGKKKKKERKKEEEEKRSPVGHFVPAL